MKSKYLKRLVSSIICLSMAFSLLPISAAWDGYDRNPNGDNLVKLVDFGKSGDVISAGALASSITTGDDTASLRWKDNKTTTNLKFYNVPRDWSDFTDIRFKVYSDNPESKATFALLVYTDLQEKQGVTASYYFTKSKAFTNHLGWKEFVFTKADDFAGNYAMGWDRITGICLSSSWTGSVKDENADFCVSSIYGYTGEGEPMVKIEPTKTGEAAVFETLGNNTAIMNFSNNIIKNGKIEHVAVEDRITTDHSGTIAKFGLFSNALGATVNQDGGRVTITLDGQTVDATDMVITHDDGKYLPVNPVLEALGKTVKTYDMVTIIGDEKITDKIFDDALLLEDLKFLLNISVLDQEDITQAEWDKAKKQWREYLIGPPGNLDDPVKQKKIAAAEKTYKETYNTINRDPELFALFGKTAITTWGHVLSAATKIKNMAKAYAMEGSQYYRDPDARRTLLECLEWMYQNVYGLDELANQGWKNRVDQDRWNFHIGIPMEITEAILLLGDDISMEDTKKYLYVFEQSKSSTLCGPAGRIYAGTLSAVLHQNYKEVLARNKDYVKYMRSNNYKVNDVLQKGYNSGVKEDWLYITHEAYAYSGAYGVTTLLDRLVTVEAILMGTQFEFVNPYKYDPVMWMKETFGPIMFNGALSSAQSGRFRGDDAYSETSYARFVIASAVDLIGCFGKDDDEWLKSFVKRNVVDANRSAINNNLNSYQLEKLELILNDDSIVAEPYYNSKVYYTGDSVAHQKGDFGFAISMSSSRIAAWESVTGDNQNGWYQGDGLFYTYLKNDASQYVRNYWKNVNPYHLPGTTVDTQERVYASISGNKFARTSQHFVGGVQFDKDYSVAAMQLEGHKCNNPGAVIKVDVAGDAPSHYSSLLAKKAWFLFDDEAVAIGTDIHAEDGFEVQTIVENRKLNKIEEIKQLSTETKEEGGTVEYGIKGVKASDALEENPPELTYDNDILTFWAAPDDVTVIWELEKAVPLGFVAIAQRNGTEGKQAIFELEISTDGDNWTQIFAGKASGQTKELEAYAAGGKQAKFIKYIGHGRTNSKNNVLTEVRFYGPTPDGNPPKMPSLTGGDGVDPNAGKILGAEQVTLDGKKLEKVSEFENIMDITNPKWLHIETVGGYFFPQGGEMKMDKVTNNNNFLEIWFTHGVNPTAGTYAYVVLPTKTAEETEQYTKNPDIEILANEKKLQVVREKTLGMTGLVFWEAGKYEGIETSVPMIMMTKDKDANGLYRINLSDPTKLLKEGKVTLKGNYEMVEGDKRFTVTQKDGETVISIDFFEAEGRTLPITLLAK